MLVTEEELGAWTLGADKYVRFHTRVLCRFLRADDRTYA
jgi:hypothetical protein